eukprot:7378346-Prymnesium_polylepis.2
MAVTGEARARAYRGPPLPNAPTDSHPGREPHLIEHDEQRPDQRVQYAHDHGHHTGDPAL